MADRYVRWAQEAEAELAAVKAERDRLRDGIRQHRDMTRHRLNQPHNIGHDGEPIVIPTNADHVLWSLIEGD